MREPNRSILFLMLAAILWSTGGLLIKLVQWHPMAIASGRSIIAAIMLCLFLRKPSWNGSAVQIGGGIAYAATMVIFVIANKLTAAANVILLQYTAPIYIALLSHWFLGEKITVFDWCVIFLVLAGMGLFFVDQLTTAGFLGNVLAIISGVTLALLFLFSRKQKSGSALESLVIGNVLAGLVGLPYLLQAPLTIESVAGICILGLFQLGLPYFLFSMAIRHVNAIDAILIPTIEPLLNPIWVFLLIGEKPGIWAFIGGLVVLTAITGRGLIQALRAKRANSMHRSLSDVHSES